MGSAPSKSGGHLVGTFRIRLIVPKIARHASTKPSRPKDNCSILLDKSSYFRHGAKNSKQIPDFELRHCLITRILGFSAIQNRTSDGDATGSLTAQLIFLSFSANNPAGYEILFRPENCGRRAREYVAPAYNTRPRTRVSRIDRVVELAATSPSLAINSCDTTMTSVAAAPVTDVSHVSITGRSKLSTRHAW